jgi:hypothetical protein
MSDEQLPVANVVLPATRKKKKRSEHPREKLPGKAYFPIWVTDKIHKIMGDRAVSHYRSRGKELEYMLEVVDRVEQAEWDRIAALNVPVLTERKLEDTL